VQKRLATGPAITSALALFRDKHWIIEEQNKALSLVM
jgi:hypothetical protein